MKSPTVSIDTDPLEGDSAGWFDTHHHIVPEFYAKALEAAGGDPNGLPIPVWTPAAAYKKMTAMGISKAIVSVTTPGVAPWPTDRAKVMARKLNEYSHELVQSDPTHFVGYFAILPDLNDVDGAVAEIEYAFDHLSPVGVIVESSYPLTSDNNDTEWRYLGHPAFAPVWAALAERNAIVFVHPSGSPAPRVNKYLPMPIMDFPHETARTATDLIYSGVVKAYPSLKFILSHAGGTLPMLADRISGSPIAPVSVAEFTAGVASFYYDLAIATGPGQLEALLKITTSDHILFGSDTPHNPDPFVLVGISRLQTSTVAEWVKLTGENARTLFPKL